MGDDRLSGLCTDRLLAADGSMRDCFVGRSIDHETLTKHYKTGKPLSKNNSATRRDDELILEGIVTTQREDGTTNISPMGPVVNRDFTYLRLRPSATSSTYQNLRRHRHGVFHITDDVDVLVRSALGLALQADLAPVPGFPGPPRSGRSNCVSPAIRRSAGT